MHDVIKMIKQQRIVAILRMENYDFALEIAQALLDGGINVIEFTLSGKNAYHAISTVRNALDGRVMVGVGTVLQPGEVDEAKNAGAQFVVTPTINMDVIATCCSQQLPLVCGAFTPTEALSAHQAGAEMIKIFPARVGGPGYIRDLLAPLPFLQLVPTGGVNDQNAQSYIDAGAIAVGIGSNLLPKGAVERKDWKQITLQAQKYRNALL